MAYKLRSCRKHNNRKTRDNVAQSAFSCEQRERKDKSQGQPSLLHIPRG